MMQAVIIILFVMGLIAIVAWCVYGLRWLIAHNKEKSAEMIEELDDDGRDGQQD